mmetsp:Transcript_52666/g.120026  ORF Transcript_52666/g.120026 Transcript_52666/m.120026 type:complete len:107 (+) Transcript_52666:58-378(+)|eukprot:CAMPEP_0172615158 /NCGR_PEP_ID=MMETSP1068-20121228/55981_1 /TAXON_ID=35684 /ORGANISM="Pseudopedinella elastica, Strain CCMP716" /LENGTH=106 /DNA_ID=CAMNT_0013420197 /DNA_START=38 /DNA_END=358 /DNA_ORIENTATION=+
MRVLALLALLASAAAFSPSVLKVQRGQLEKQLKDKVALQKQLAGEVPALRKQVAGLDFEIMMSGLKAEKAQEQAVTFGKTTTAPKAPVKEEEQDFFSGLRKMFGMA